MDSNAASLRRARRRLLSCCALLVAGAPLLGRNALAAEMVDPNSAQAKSLNYVTDAKQAKDPKRKPDQFCHNCQFYQGSKDAKSAPCSVFAGKSVPAQAWCSAWVKKSG